MRRVMEFPTTIPIFALPNVVLFPGVPLPLHIFEPRYRDMVRDAIAGHSIIGMALLRGDWQRRYEERPEIFEICCAGKIVNVEPLPDGKYNILLRGLREIRVQRHLFDKSYREAEITWRPSPVEQIPGTLRGTLINQLTRFLKAAPSSPAQRLLGDEGLTDSMLVNFFSYALEIDPLEKQSLLEANDLGARAERLAELLEFHLEEARINVPLPDSERRH